jgi:anthranilate/para-aminobenzoate synthase component II
VPTIGVCLDHEIIATAYQSKIKRMRDYQAKKTCFIKVIDDPIFEGLGKIELMIQKKHRFHVPNPSLELNSGYLNSALFVGLFTKLLFK